MHSLDLAIIGNGTVAGLITADGEYVWACVPRFDGDPAFCSLLRNAAAADASGSFRVELVDLERCEQEYLANTPVLITRLYDRHGGCVRLTDFAPRFEHLGRTFSPMMFVRQIHRESGVPRIRVRLRPTCDAGRSARTVTFGSHHIRYVGGDTPLRLTTDASIAAILEEQWFVLDDGVTLLLGTDETVQDSAASIGRLFAEKTIAYWRDWVRSLAIPFEWQDDVIRAAITLHLNAVEDTGAIVAAVTTSIPEAADSGRTWDYRYCWLRDGFMVVHALNRLGATRTMEQYLRYVVNIAAGSTDGRLQPVYGITGRAELPEWEADALPGYRGMGPVRFGNLAYQQTQHDVYGSAILSATHIFFDKRLVQGADASLYRRLEVLGERAIELYDQPDAGLWEFRGRMERHTFSAVMCWAACDRLARIGSHLGLPARAEHWRRHADVIHGMVSDQAWNASLESFTGTLGGDTLDASVLLLHEVGFIAANDARFVSTVRAIELALKRGEFVFRYVRDDGLGQPKNAFLVCSFWFVNALAAVGRVDEARALFESLLACRNRHGLLAEHIDPVTREQWGNFVQTYSMVGLINCAVRLSATWESAF